MTGRVPPDAINEAIFDEQALTALPAWLARAAGARSAIIQWRHLDGVHEIMAFSHYSPERAAAYAWKYAPIDPWVKAALASPSRDALRVMDGLVPPASLDRSRFRREFSRPWGDDTAHAAVAVFDSACGDAIVSLYRGRREPPFVDADLAALGDHLPELGRLLRARGEVLGRRRQEEVRRDSLDGVALASIVVGADGHVVRVNLGADQVLRRADGLRTKDGFLCCVDPGSRLRLHEALALATAPENAVATAIPVERSATSAKPAQGPKRPLAYVVSVTPLSGEGDEVLAMLVFHDPDATEKSWGARLRDFLRPARAESRRLTRAPIGLSVTRA
jgi:hypothetical protein